MSKTAVSPDIAKKNESRMFLGNKVFIDTRPHFLDEYRRMLDQAYGIKQHETYGPGLKIPTLRLKLGELAYVPANLINLRDSVNGRRPNHGGFSSNTHGRGFFIPYRGLVHPHSTIELEPHEKLIFSFDNLGTVGHMLNMSGLTSRSFKVPVDSNNAAIEINDMLRECPLYAEVQVIPKTIRKSALKSYPAVDKKGARIMFYEVPIDSVVDTGFRMWNIVDIVEKLNIEFIRTLGNSSGWTTYLHSAGPAVYVQFTNWKYPVHITKGGVEWQMNIVVIYGNQRGMPTEIFTGFSPKGRPYMFYPFKDRWARVYSHQAYSTTFAHNVRNRVARYLLDIADPKNFVAYRRRMENMETQWFRSGEGLAKGGSGYGMSAANLSPFMKVFGKSAARTHVQLLRSARDFSGAMYYNKFAFISQIANRARALISERMTMRDMGRGNTETVRKLINTYRFYSVLFETDWGTAFGSHRVTDADVGATIQKKVMQEYVLHKELF